jgi:hypothetical protein
MARRFGYFHLVAALVAGVALGVGFTVLLPHFKKLNGPWEDWVPVSKIETAINECLVKEMRSQPSNMIATVYSVCAERNGR